MYNLMLFETNFKKSSVLVKSKRHGEHEKNNTPFDSGLKSASSTRENKISYPHLSQYGSNYSTNTNV